jgi:hypothetical protein
VATLQDFRTNITAQLGLDAIGNSDQTFVDGWVNEGVVEVMQRCRINVVSGTLILVAAQFDYTLSTTILALEEMFVTPVGQTQAYLMYRKTPGEIIQMRVGASGGTPPVRFYALNGATTLMVYPTPTAADVITYYNVPRPATLSSPADTPSDIPVEWHKAIEYYGCFRAAQYTDNSSSQMGQMWQKLYEAELIAIKKAMRQRGGRKLSPAVVGRYPGRVSLIGSPSQQGV